jgi:parallel beta-helix repeat protein
MYSDKGDPSKLKVKVATSDGIIRVLPKISNLAFNNLAIEGSNKHLIRVDQGSNIHFNNCDLQFSGDYALHAVGSNGLIVENSKIADALNGAIFLQYQDKGLVVRNTTFDRISSFPGMGENGEMQSTGIYMSETSSDGLIECNKFTNMGYIAINFNGNNTIVRNNLIDTFCTVKDDGAAIYTYIGKANTEFSGRKVINNIILNGTGAVEGTKPYGASDFPYVEGIYIDDNASGVEIKGNLIANIKGGGIYLHNARNIAIKENHVYNTGSAIKFVHDDLGEPIRNVTVSNNYFLNKAENQQHVFVRSKENDLDKMGDFDNNIYVGPRKDNVSFGTEFPNSLGIKSSSRSSLNEWKNNSGMDKSSTQKTISETRDVILNEFGEIKMSNGDFEFPVPDICWVPRQIPSDE